MSCSNKICLFSSDPSCNEALVWPYYPVSVDVTPSSEYSVTKGTSYGSLQDETSSWRGATMSNYNEFVQVMYNELAQVSYNEFIQVSYNL